MWIIKAESFYLQYIIVANNVAIFFSFYSANVDLAFIWIPGMTTRKQNPNVAK